MAQHVRRSEKAGLVKNQRDLNEIFADTRRLIALLKDLQAQWEEAY